MQWLALRRLALQMRRLALAMSCCLSLSRGGGNGPARLHLQRLALQGAAAVGGKSLPDGSARVALHLQRLALHLQRLALVRPLLSRPPLLPLQRLHLQRLALQERLALLSRPPLPPLQRVHLERLALHLQTCGEAIHQWMALHQRLAL